MTADIELLPLPKWLLEAFTDPTIEMLCDYTRANVAHATAPLQAEVEALRVRADAMAGEAIKHEARAERLAEALRGMVGFYGERVDAECRTKDWRELEAIEAARAALRDHDKEGKDG